MTLVELLKSGIESQDWGQIEEAYEMLTGIAVKVAEMQPADVQVTPRPPKLRHIKTKQTKATTSQPQSPKTHYGGVVKFVSIPSTPLERAEAAKLYTKPPTEKGGRVPPVKPEVQCIRCHKTFYNIPNILITANDGQDYICGECIGAKT